MGIEISTTTTADIGAYVSANVTGLWPVILLIISIPLTFYILRKIQQIFPSR
jgi:hypothetical protein